MKQTALGCQLAIFTLGVTMCSWLMGTLSSRAALSSVNNQTVTKKIITEIKAMHQDTPVSLIRGDLHMLRLKSVCETYTSKSQKHSSQYSDGVVSHKCVLVLIMQMLLTLTLPVYVQSSAWRSRASTLKSVPHSEERTE